MKKIILVVFIGCFLEAPISEAGVTYIRNEDQLDEYAKSVKQDFIARKQSEIEQLEKKKSEEASFGKRREISREIRKIEKVMEDLEDAKVKPSSLAKPLSGRKVGDVWLSDQPRTRGKFEVLRRVNQNNLLVAYYSTVDDFRGNLVDGIEVREKEQISDKAYWIKGIDASKIVEGEVLYLKGLFRLTGVKEYRTLIGAKRSAIVIEPHQLPKATPKTNPDSKNSPTIENSIGMKLVRIPAGTFLMGSEPSEEGSKGDEHPKYQVKISESFYVGAYEVTMEQYASVMQLGKPEERLLDVAQGNLSWEDAQKFCETLSALPSEKSAGRQYRLPTEAEWEYVCRAGTETSYFFGDTADELKAHARTVDEGYVDKVGTKNPNAWGIYDIQGNVTEWCSDWYSASFYKTPDSSTDPQGPVNGQERVHRGSSPASKPQDSRSAARWHFVPDKRYPTLGVRVVCEVK